MIVYPQIIIIAGQQTARKEREDGGERKGRCGRVMAAFIFYYLQTKELLKLV